MRFRSGVAKAPLIWAPLVLAAAARDSIVTGEAWQVWEDCKDDMASRRLNAGGILAAPKFVHMVTEDKHRLIELGEAGELILSSADTPESVLQRLKDEKEPIHVIAVFGRVKAGKSTLATSLSCAFSHLDGHMGDATPATHFPPGSATDGEGREITHTYGLWSSPPFDFKDSKGRVKKFVLLDLEGLASAEQQSGGASGSAIDDPRKREHALVKLIAMLSEVVSVFVYVTLDEQNSQQDYDLIGNALQITRRNLITADGKEGQHEAVQQEFMSLTRPRLLISHRRQHFRDLIREDAFAANVTFMQLHAESTFKKHCHLSGCSELTEWGKLMRSNFEPFAFEEQDPIPFAFAHVPAQPNTDGHSNRYAWHDEVWAYANDDDTQGGHHCAHYMEMYDTDFKCLTRSKRGVASPTRPATFKMLVDSMAGQIAEIAEERRLKHGGVELQLTGKLFVDFLTVSVQEMNKIRPLPEARLWHLILQETCEATLTKLVDSLLGHAEHDTYGAGALRAIKEVMDAKRLAKHPKADDVPNWIQSMWARREQEVHSEMEFYFSSDGKEPLGSVRDSCEGPVREHIDTYRSLKERYYWEAKQMEAEWEKEELRKELTKVQWEKNKWFYAMFAGVGAIAFSIFSKIATQLRPLTICIGWLCCCFSRRRAKTLQPATLELPGTDFRSSRVFMSTASASKNAGAAEPPPNAVDHAPSWNVNEPPRNWGAV